MNWNISLDQHRAGKLFVWEESESGLPVAYLWGNLNRSDSILEVHPRYRGQGIGRSIAMDLMNQARRDEEPLLEIECAPESSEPFWRAMGFRIWDDGRTIMGRQILGIPKSQPSASNVSVTVEFHQESYLYAKPCPAPIIRYDIVGAVGRDNVIHFDRVVAEFDLGNGRDLVVRVLVDGVEIFADKAKRDSAREVGVMPCQGGFKLGWTRIP